MDDIQKLLAMIFIVLCGILSVLIGAVISQ